MIDVQDYLVTRDIALRTGSIQYKYRTADGQFIVDNRTLSKIKLTSDEFINGLQGIKKISKEEAKTLIAQNDFQMGDTENAETNEKVREESTVIEESISEDEVGSLEEVINIENTEE